MLTPVLVSGYGRSGTTALMALLATDHPDTIFANILKSLGAPPKAE